MHHHSANAPSPGEPSQPPHTPEDEISLLDILVVVLRYRRVVLAVPLAVVLIAIAGYFWYPAVQYRSIVRDAPSEARLSLRLTPAVENLLPSATATRLLLDVQFLLERFRAAGYTQIRGTNIGESVPNPAALAAVQRIVVEQRTTRGAAIPEQNRILTIRSEGALIHLLARGPNPEAVENLLHEIAAAADAEFRAFLVPDAESVVASYNALLAVPDPTPGILAAIQEGAQRYSEALRIKNTSAPLVTPRGSVAVTSDLPSIDELQDRFRVRAVVAVVAALFFALFLAFVLNYADRVKADPVAMQKLRDAMGRTRSS